MAYRPSEGRNQKKQTPPEQTNLVPIMNLFITIIPFLLTIVVISQVALVALNFSATGSTGAGGSGGRGGGKEVKVIIMASEGNQLYPGFEIRGWGNTLAIKNTDNRGAYNFLALNNTLADIQNSLHNKEITVVVYPDVLYGTLIKTIDLCKQNGFPNVIYKPASVSYGTGG
jgi:biopolymer transport protein ExbD